MISSVPFYGRRRRCRPVSLWTAREFRRIWAVCVSPKILLQTTAAPPWSRHRRPVGTTSGNQKASSRLNTPIIIIIRHRYHHGHYQTAPSTLNKTSGALQHRKPTRPNGVANDASARPSSESIFSVVWPWSLSPGSKVNDRFMLLPWDHLCWLPSKWVHLFSKHRGHKFG